MIEVTQTIKRTSKMVEETGKLEYVVRLVQYITIFSLGVLLNTLSQQKIHSKNKQKENEEKSKRQDKKQRTAKKASPTQDPELTQKPDQALNLKIQKLSKFKDRIGFTRRVLRWSIILKQFLLFKQAIFDTYYLSQIDIQNTVSLLYVGFKFLFLLLDQFVLLHGSLENQILKNRFYKWSIKYGRIPNHFFGATKYLVYLVLWYYFGKGDIGWMVVMLFVQNVLDFAMYLIVYFKGNWNRAIGVLGIITSVISLNKAY